ncbi:hypothetical protein HWV62_21388 [Athelia sp. TMB]|nr:hypothetical protein HWV62_21388 [Athelia sp. TMB]
MSVTKDLKGFDPVLASAPETVERHMPALEEIPGAKEKLAGKVPTKTTSHKRKVGDEDGNVEDAPVPTKPTKKAKGKASPDLDASTAAGVTGDLFSISLPGEEEGKVEIYDSCDELRKKINAHLAGGPTKAAFLRDILRAAASPEYPIKLQAKQLGDFLALKGATGGSSSKVCYAAYVYFEKKRVAEGKPKSKHRLGMEEAWGTEGGLSREMRRGGYWCAPGDKVIEDQFGKVKLVGKGVRK